MLECIKCKKKLYFDIYYTFHDDDGYYNPYGYNTEPFSVGKCRCCNYIYNANIYSTYDEIVYLELTDRDFYFRIYFETKNTLYIYNNAEIFRYVAFVSDYEKLTSKEVEYHINKFKKLSILV